MDDDIQLPNFRSIRMPLIDTDVVHRSEQNIKVFVCPLGIMISAEGYGTADGATVPVAVMQRNGELVVSVRADINRHGRTHEIPLGTAREINRRQQEADTR